MKKIIISFILVLFFASCEKVIEIDPLASESKLVLNAIPSAEQQLFVNLSYSHFFLDTSNYHPVQNADIVVKVNGTEYRPTSTRRCNYFFDYTLQEDDSLDITVYADGKTITASTYVPRLPQITNLVAAMDTSSAFNVLAVNFDITDHPDYQNYYCFRITEHDSGEYYHPLLEYLDTIDTVYTDYFFCYDKVLTDNPMATEATYGYPYFATFLTTDANFDGQTHNTTLYLMILRDTNEIQPFTHQYQLTVECVTPDRYQYLKDLAQASSMTSMITEPPAVHTNINGALGIFAGNAKRVFPLITLADGQPVTTSKVTIPQVIRNSMQRTYNRRVKKK